MRAFVPALAVLALSIAAGHGDAQTTSAPVEGLRENPSRFHALVGARVVTAPGKVIENGTVILRDGLVVDVGAGLAAPAGARTWNLAGRTVYAGLVESETAVGLPEEFRPPPPASGRAGITSVGRPARGRRAEPPTPPRSAAAPGGSASWNPKVTPQRAAAELFRPDEKGHEILRSLGFTAAVVTPGRGVFRGASALVATGDAEPTKAVIRPGVAQHAAFEQSGFGEAVYPGSLMGAVALVRQTLADAQWHRAAREWAEKNPTAAERPEDNRALLALAPVVEGRVGMVFNTDDELDPARIARVAQEFKVRLAALRGSGLEYRSLESVRAAKAPVILPMNFPDVPEVETAERALDVPLNELEHWQEAPANAGKLHAAGVAVAFTAAGLDKTDKFWPRVRETVKRGLPPEAALAAVTTVPAKIFGAEDRLGVIEKGRPANLTVASGDLFKDDDAAVVAVWVDGDWFETDKGRERDVRGTWTVTIPDAPSLTLKIAGEPSRPRVTAGEKDSVPASIQAGRLVLAPPQKLLGAGEGTVRLSAALPPEGPAAPDFLAGIGQRADGREFRWEMRRTAGYTKPAPKEDAQPKPPVPLPAAYPAGAFGFTKEDLVAPPAVLVRGATVWTSGPQGRLENADLLIENGKVKAIGANLAAPPNAKVIDAAGKHVTPGIIDCHSHTGISRGVNEGTSAITCEVRIADVTDPTDIGLYRELAGGLTVANQLHGSANPIGGQNQVIKLRWGMPAEALHFAGAKPGVKFALGENVKQANWGERFTTRYPQTRMGVDEIMRDTFHAARDYARRLDEAKKGASVPPVRRDLRLEAALEIVRGDRLIHCHAYRQDEMLMLVRLAEEFGIRLSTFQHVLEGYKIADVLARHGVGASSFADWWNYKIEASDAIPFNPAMLVRAGVLTSVNSDSGDLARRLNTEAAKAMKHGGLSPEEALKLVTLWPAMQLQIDKQVGSLEPGKDGDFVIWDALPLSSYAKAEQTWIDGRCHFDRARDARLREEATKRRELLVQRALPERLKAIAGPGGGGAGRDAAPDAEKKPEQSEAEESFTARLLRHREIHWEREQRSLYHDGTDAHNCSSAEGR